LQTIHPGFVATEAVKNSGQPTPYEISEDEAVRYILEGINSEVNENYFPPGLALATRFGRISPLWLRRRVLLGTVPKEY
jgi:hypothetical protein